jgi:hypothetical protein
MNNERFNHGIRWKWIVGYTLRFVYRRDNNPVSFTQEDGSASEPVLMLLMEVSDQLHVLVSSAPV